MGSENGREKLDHPGNKKAELCDVANTEPGSSAVSEKEASFPESKPTTSAGISSEGPAKRLVVPPGLIHKLVQFISHYHVVGKKPTIVDGPTGVGKSLFLNLFKTLYEEETGNKGKVLTLNCSHYTEELARSELFGHVKGAFTGAAKDKVGLIEVADGGALILEEVGELSKEVQAKLLTVIEDGFFIKVGGTKMDQVKEVLIIGTTNDPVKLREDFRQRFIRFHVPPLHERRKDVLYHIAHKFPDVIRELLPWEVLTLLGYHWPGNVREIERLCLLVRRRKRLSKDIPIAGVEIFDASILQALDQEDWPRDFSSAGSLYEKLQKGGVDVSRLESLLNRFGMGLRYHYIDRKRRLPKDSKKVFSRFSIADLPPDPFYEEYRGRFNIDILSGCRPFENAYNGFLLFCSLFFQDPRGKCNVLQINKATSMDFCFDLDKVPKAQQREINTLSKPIFECLSGVKLPAGTQIPLAYTERVKFFNELADAHSSNEFLASITGRSPSPKQSELPQQDIYSMTYDDFMKLYHAEVVRRASGNRAEAARRLGLKYQTFISSMKRYGLR